MSIVTDPIDHYVKQGDTKGAIERQLQYDDGSAIDLTGCTVTFDYQPKGKNGSAAPVSRSATIVDTVGGVVSYAWTAADTDTPGIYIYEWRIIDGSSNPLTVPNNSYGLFQVVPRIR